MKVKGKIGILLGMVLFTGFMGVAWYMQEGTNQETDPRYISVILYGSDLDRWESLKQGADQAAEDYHAELTYVLMAEEYNEEAQLALIQREINNGADGILLAASSSQMDLGTLQLPQNKYPIVCVESGVENEQTSLISADNYAMGESLAQAVMEKENAIAKIAIIMDNQQRDSVKARYEGFCDKIVEKFDRLTFWSREEGENKAMLFVQRELTQEAVDVVVAFDNSSLEAVIDAVLNLNKKVKIYGIANSDKAVYYLDHQKIRNLVYQDEFSLGYVGLECLLEGEQYGEDSLNAYLSYRIVDDVNLYLAENQRILFPFVK